MPPPQEPPPQIPQAPTDPPIAELIPYPREAFDFVRKGLSFTVDRIHAALTDPTASRHVSGQQLCAGLRDFALARWGLLARTVLRRWNLTRTEDFGRIVFTLVESGEMSRTEHDTIKDFDRVYDFAAAFDAAYRISGKCNEIRS